MCDAKLRSTILTGTFASNIWVWNGKSLRKALKAHTGPVTAINTDDTRVIAEEVTAVPSRGTQGCSLLLSFF
jgi:hypothetical protein